MAASGGGSQNQLLCQWTADATNKQVLAGPVEATAIGNALMQAISLEIVDTLAAGRELVARSFPLRDHQPEASNGWDEVYERFTERIGVS